ncbi:hypothetical protein SBRY_20222 [Actinacidiphila bryophytorum]|uniref:Uncharacterized protein n=1 Tax=Actinacidiphila bryophytorum TaxID=1436133 RepID=A0A9W4GZF1_9ACTN|nr:hypothetical protein SBRY_20222 [Actinacidiphila bryophytorum]
MTSAGLLYWVGRGREADPCSSAELVLLHDRLALGALQLVGGVRLKRVPVTDRTLVTLRHGTSSRGVRSHQKRAAEASWWSDFLIASTQWV